MKETKVFSVPVEWAVYSTVDIKASSPEEALRIFKETKDDIELPTDHEYVDSSFKISCDNEEEAIDYMNM